MEYTIHIGNQPLILEQGDFDEHVDIDALTGVESSNIFGEATTISAATNRFGMLKADAEKKLSDLKLDIRLLESNIKAEKRKQASENSGFYKMSVDGVDFKVKLTEKALESCFEMDDRWVKLKREFIDTEKQLNYITSIHWSMQDKCRKLNGVISSTTPKEFVDELIEGKINGILVKKK